MSIDTNPVDLVTYRAWDAYFDVRKRQFGSRKGAGDGPFCHKYKTDFSAMAQWCVANDVDVEDYVSTVTDYLSDTGKRAFLPRDYNKDGFRTRYLRMRQANKGGDPEVSWKIQEQHVRGMCARAPHMYPRLLDPLVIFDLPLEPWFRVAFSIEPVADTLKIFGKSAWEDIVGNRPLRRFLRTRAPHVLQELERLFGKFAD